MKEKILNKGSPVVRTYTFKLYNRKTYRTKFYNWIGCCRFLYNLGKEAKDFAYENFKKNLSYYDLANQLKDLKKEYAFLKQVRSCGHIAKENRKTQSLFVCVKCAHTANADINAAHNIKKAGVAAIYSLT